MALANTGFLISDAFVIDPAREPVEQHRGEEGRVARPPGQRRRHLQEELQVRGLRQLLVQRGAQKHGEKQSRCSYNKSNFTHYWCNLLLEATVVKLKIFNTEKNHVPHKMIYLTHNKEFTLSHL